MFVCLSALQHPAECCSLFWGTKTTIPPLVWTIGLRTKCRIHCKLELVLFFCCVFFFVCAELKFNHTINGLFRFYLSSTIPILSKSKSTDPFQSGFQMDIIIIIIIGWIVLQIDICNGKICLSLCPERIVLYLVIIWSDQVNCTVFLETLCPLMYFPIQPYICFGESACGLLLLSAQV